MSTITKDGHTYPASAGQPGRHVVRCLSSCCTAGGRYYSPGRIDPPNCGCLDCDSATNYSVPLDAATPQQVRDMLAGKLTDATGHEFEGQVTIRSRYDHSVIWTGDWQDVYPDAPRLADWI